MKKLKSASVVLLVIGVLTIFYGWIQTLGGDLEDKLQSYVLVVSGILLIIISAIVDWVVKAIEETKQEFHDSIYNNVNNKKR